MGVGQAPESLFRKKAPTLVPPAQTHIHSYNIHYNIDVDRVVVGVCSRVAETDAMWDSTVSVDALVVDVGLAAIGVVVGAFVLLHQKRHIMLALPSMILHTTMAVIMARMQLMRLKC